MIRPALVMTAVIAAAVPTLAHHGAGTFELSKSVTFKNAKLTKIELINPHSWIYFEAPDASGKIQKYRCEMRSVHTLRRSGWTKDLFPVGAKMTVEASPDRADANSCYLQTILFENGNRMDRYGQYVKGTKGAVTEVRGQVNVPDATKRAFRRPTGEPNLAGDWAPEQMVMADPRGTGGGLMPLGRIGTAQPAAPRAGGGGNAAGGARRGGGAAPGPRLYNGTELTERGTAEAAKFTQADNPRFKCETTSIIFDWTFDGPVNRITQNKDTIVLQYGQMGLKRTIYMNMKTHPATTKPTRAGHSIGHWEGDTLVVDTVGFLPGVLNGTVRHSEQLHVVERFTLDEKTMKLTRAYTAQDPVYLKGTYSGQDVIEIADAPYTEDNCKEQGFLDYSKQVSK